MMTDRELIEMAALAAGVELKHDPFWESEDVERVDWYWNPLLCNHDAFSLMSKLRIRVKPGKYIGDGATAESADGKTAGATVFSDNGMEFQIRRAITMVAAEIGKNLKETTS